MNGNNKRKRNNKQNRKNKKNTKNTSLEKKKDDQQIQPIPSSSPRPCSLSKNNSKFDAKRSSGSEFEEFQTPSIEYDIKREGFEENSHEDFGSNDDKEWDEIGSFENDQLEHVTEQKNMKMEGDIIVKNKCFVHCNGDVVRVQESCMILIGDKEEDGDIKETGVKLAGIEKEDDPREDEVLNKYVDTFFGDLDEECCNYKVGVRDKEVVYEISKYECRDGPDMFTGDCGEADGLISSCNIDESNLDYLMTEKEDEETKESNDEHSNLLCTEENLREETLSFNCIMLEVRSEPQIQKSMTLRPKASESLAVKSETSHSNLASVSFDNIPQNIKKEDKLTKKDKFNLYQKILKKFRKEKTPEKTVLKNETLDHNLSLKSGDFIKDSEIESNQSLKSINSFGNNSQYFCETSPKEMTETEHVVDVEDERIVNVFTDINILVEDVPLVAPVKKKREKSEHFKNILKKKQQTKKVSDERIVVEMVIEKKEKFTAPNVEIEKDVLAEFDETIKSLRCCDADSEWHTTVIIKENAVPHIETDTKEYQFDGGDDHLFPDAITATKISATQCSDIPYMDDPVIYQQDAKSFFNGESKRLRISPEYWVPMASMESLIFPDDSKRNTECLEEIVSKSPCRRKRVLGSILSIMSKGR